MDFITKNKHILAFMILLVSTFVTKELNFLMYDSTQSPDFSRYFIYFEHFANTEVPTLTEHGLLYYYIHYINYYFNYNHLAENYLLIHKSIQQVNFYIYAVGMVGYYKLLRVNKFNRYVILLTFTLINFIPVSIVQRIVFKPEILAFALFPWILFSIEKYKSTGKFVYLYVSIPIFIASVTLKGNVLVILSVYLLLANIRLILNIKNLHLIAISSLLLIMFGILSYENSQSNGKNIFDIQSGSTTEEKYNNKAPIKTIFNVNTYDLITSPVKHKHADSFIGITLLETYGDYFDLYWDNDCCNYFKSRKQFLLFEVSNEIKPPEFNENNSTITLFNQKNTDYYPLETVGLILSVYFFFLLIKYLITDYSLRKYLVAIYLGMAIIILHAISGFPANNFDPNVGDTFKPHYYSFVFLLSTIFLFARLIENKKNKGFLLFLVVFSFLNMGFFKVESNDLNQNLKPYIEMSDTCQITKNIYKNNLDIQNIECFDFDNNENGNKLFEDKFLIKPINLTILLFIIFSLISLIYIKEPNEA